MNNAMLTPDSRLMRRHFSSAGGIATAGSNSWTQHMLANLAQKAGAPVRFMQEDACIARATTNAPSREHTRLLMEHAVALPA